MGCGKWRKDVQQQRSFSVRILGGGKLQHIKQAITLNRVCIHQSICMQREHAEAWRAASHAGLGNNYSGAACRALLMDRANRWREKTMQELGSCGCQAPLRVRHIGLGKSFLKGEADYTGCFSQGSCLVCARKKQRYFCCCSP